MQAPDTFRKVSIDILLQEPSRSVMEYGRYLVVRKDGKIHLEIWNGTGWAYNHKVITHFYLPKVQ